MHACFVAIFRLSSILDGHVSYAEVRTPMDKRQQQRKGGQCKMCLDEDQSKTCLNEDQSKTCLNEDQSKMGLNKDQSKMGLNKDQSKMRLCTDPCMICHKNNIAVLFLPCRHAYTCSDCAVTVEQCRICDNVIRGLSRL
jgi:hypothetical protein